MNVRHRLRMSARVGGVAEMKAPSEPLALSIKDTARLTGLSRTTIYELIAEGRLDAFKIGAATRITTASIKALIATAPRRTAA
jgi:excisionase family DNA binding protein